MVTKELNIFFTYIMQKQQTIWEQKKKDIIQQLSKADIESLISHSQRTELSPGQIWYLNEEGNSRIYILDRGYVRMCRLVEEDDRRVILGFLGPSDIFGDLPGTVALMQAGANYIEAVQDTRLISIESPVFWEVLKKYPNFMMRLIEILSQQQQRLEKRVLSLSVKDVYARIAETLLDLAEKFGENCSEGNCQSHIALTHQDISDLAGIARPTVSKVIAGFIRAGVLRKHKRHLGLSNMSELLAVAEQGFQAIKPIEKKLS